MHRDLISAYAAVGARLDQQQQSRARLQTKLDAATKRRELLGKAIDVLMTLAVEQQTSTLAYIQELLTTGVREVFQEPWDVKLEETTKANQRSIEIYLVTSAGHIRVPDSVGGGVTQVISVLMRLLIVSFRRDTTAQFVVLDESLSHLAEVYISRAATLLRQVATELNIQVVLITHQPDLTVAADIVYLTQQEVGITTYTKSEAYDVSTDASWETTDGGEST